MKSQRRVNFPISDLDPFAYSVTKDDPDFNTTDLELNLTESDLEFKGTNDEFESNEKEGCTSVTPPLLGEGEESSPLAVSAEVHEEGNSKLENIAKGSSPSQTENKEQESPAEETEGVSPSETEGITSSENEGVSPSETQDNKGGVSPSEEGEDKKERGNSKESVPSNKPHLNLSRTYSRTTSVYMSSRPIYDLFAITVSNSTHSIN